VKTRLTNKEGEVRELTDRVVRKMRPMSEVLPTSLQRAIKQRERQKAPMKAYRRN